MVEFLLPSGYDTLTIDEFWYRGNCAVGSGCTDAYGRPQPDTSKWPSAAGGNGFRGFTDRMHAKGLKVGRICGTSLPKLCQADRWADPSCDKYIR